MEQKERWTYTKIVEKYSAFKYSGEINKPGIYELMKDIEDIVSEARKDERERAKDMILDVIQETDWIEEPKSAFGRLNEALKGLDNNK